MKNAGRLGFQETCIFNKPLVARKDMTWQLPELPGTVQMVDTWNILGIHPWKLTWIPKMIVWKWWLLLNMAIFGIYVKFLRDIPSSKNHGGWTFRPIPEYPSPGYSSGICRMMPLGFRRDFFRVDDVLWPPQDPCFFCIFTYTTLIPLKSTIYIYG